MRRAGLSAGRWSRRRADDRGAAIVEAAILLPVFIVLLLAILEGGRLLMLNQSMRAASSNAARSAAISTNDVAADYNILQSIKRNTQGRIPYQNITKIVVFEAATSTSSVPANCLIASQTNVCNLYTGADLNLAESDLSNCTSTSKARFWCPTTRKYATVGANGPPDWIGVYIEARAPLVTKLFGNTVTLKDTQVTRIEATSIA